MDVPKSEGISPISLLSEDELSLIFKELSFQDLLIFSSLSKWWQSNVEKLLAREFFGNEENLKGEQGFRKLFSPSSIGKYVFNMEQWNQEQVAKVIKSPNFLLLEKILIKNLERKLLKESLSLVVTTNKDLASFLLVHYFVKLDVVSETVVESTSLTHSFDAWSAVQDAATHISWITIYDEVHEIFTTVVKQTAKDAVLVAKSKYVCKSDNEIEADDWKLSNLYVLALIAQKKYRDEQFKETYQRVKKSFESKESFNLSTDEIINIYADAAWNNNYLKNNPYVDSLERLAKTLAKRVNLRLYSHP